jgi:hypothetical protein
MFQWFNRYSISNAFDPFNRFAPFIMATPVPTVPIVQPFHGYVQFKSLRL